MNNLNNQVAEQRINEIIPMYNPSLIRLIFLTVIVFLSIGLLLLYVIPTTKVLTGKTIIVRNSNPVYALVYLPAEGTGEIQRDMEVRIYLSNYPSSEYGFLKGKVLCFLREGIPDDSGQYILKVHLNDRLKTSNGYQISNRIVLQGTSEIIIKNRRFIDEILESIHIEKL